MNGGTLLEDQLNEMAEEFMRQMHDLPEDTEYVKKCSYGKYSIYKYDYDRFNRRSSTTVAKGLTKDEADGFMKLLKEPQE